MGDEKIKNLMKRDLQESPIVAVMAWGEIKINTKASYGYSGDIILHFIAVNKYRQGGGIGKSLIDWLISTSESRTIILTCLKTNVEAIDFYKHIGFKIEDTEKNYDKRKPPTSCHLLKLKK